MAAIGITGPAIRMDARPWHAAFYLVLLGGFFYASYGLANWVTSQRDYVPSLAFGWEHNIPFLAWTIVPYWSINLFYAASLFVCRKRVELDRHALRLFAAQIISVAAFLTVPLRYNFERPEISDSLRWMFAALASFDQPFNQAPSLHLSLTVIVAARFLAHLRGFESWLLRAWFVLVGLSALTTYQHHFVDIPTGIWVGALCCMLIPDRPETWDEHQERRPALSGMYLGGSMLMAALAVWMGGWALWLLWPAGACLIVASIYFTGRPALFRKQDGSIPPSIQFLLAPYLAAAWLNSRWWTRGEPAACEIASGVWIGRLPTSRERAALGIASMVDMTAELPAAAGSNKYKNIPVLDLTVPTAAQFDRTVASIEDFEADRPTLVCCALGYARSAAAVAAWLVATRRAASVDAAIAMIEERRRVALTPDHRSRLNQWAREKQYVAPGNDDANDDAPDETFAQRFVRALIVRILVGAARVVTGAEARWVGCAPAATQRIYVANHTSHADFIVLWSSLPHSSGVRTHPVAAADYWRRNVIRRYLAERIFRAVLVERNSAGHAHNPLDPLLKALRAGNSLIMFPEGTRGQGAELLPFKCGIYHLACTNPNVELVPVWIHNLHRVLPRGAMLPVPLQCSIVFGEPKRLLPGEHKEDFLTRLRRAVIETGRLCSSTTSSS